MVQESRSLSGQPTLGQWQSQRISCEIPEGQIVNESERFYRELLCALEAESLVGELATCLMATSAGDDVEDIREGYSVRDLAAARQCQSDRDLVEQNGDESGPIRPSAILQESSSEIGPPSMGTWQSLQIFCDSPESQPVDGSERFYCELLCALEAESLVADLA